MIAGGLYILIVVGMALLLALGFAVLVTVVLYSIDGVPDFIEDWLDRRISESRWW